MITLTNGDFPARAYSIAIQGNDVYVYGTQGNSQLNQSAKYWKNGFAIELTDGTQESVAPDITVNNGDVYVCGIESSSHTLALFKQSGKNLEKRITCNLTKSGNRAMNKRDGY